MKPVFRSEASLRRELCTAGRTLYDRGLIGPTDGNLSARVGERTLLCTPSGAHKGELSPDDLVKVTLDGRVVTRGTPSSELKMHLGIYLARPDVACIVHAHPPCAVGLTVAGVSLEHPVVPEILFAIGAVPTVPYASPTTSDVPDSLRPILARCNAFMLSRHGSVILCDSPREGVLKTEILEHTARITLAARISGGASPLPDAEVQKLLNLAAARAMDTRPRARTPETPETPGTDVQDEDAMVEAITRAVIARLRG